MLSLSLRQVYYWYAELLALENLESHLEGEQQTLSIAVGLGVKKARHLKRRLLKKAFEKVKVNASTDSKTEEIG